MGLLMLCLMAWQAVVAPAAMAAAGAASRVGPRATGVGPAAPVAQAGGVIDVYGPRLFQRTAGPLTRAVEQFSLPTDALAPYSWKIENGAPDGSGRVSFARISLNGVNVVGPGELNPSVASLTRAVTLAAQNTLEVLFVGRPGSFVNITVSGTRPIPAPVIHDFNPKSGPAGTLVTLSGSALAVGVDQPAVTFTGTNGSRLPAFVSFADAGDVRVVVPESAVTGLIELTNGGGHAATAAPFVVGPSQDFTLTATPSSADAIQRASALYVIHVNGTEPNFTNLLKLSATGLPAGAAVTFDPPQVTAGASSTLRVNLAQADLAPGTYPFKLNAATSIDGREVSHTVDATLRVIAGGQTTLTGRVMSSDGATIMGATVSLDGRTATTDAAGSFILSGVTAGNERPLMIDGRTASAPNRTYPVILEPATILEGQANVVPYTFFLPPIDVQAEVEVVPGRQTVAQNPRVADLTMNVPADAHLRNRDGSPVARVSITPLDIDRTPAPLPSNVSTAIVYTSQPGGAVADVAMPVVYPNLLGADPGRRVELYAFNHDTVQWYVYGYGRVSADGRRIEPEVDPATGRPFGLRDFSWHFPSAGQGGNPGGGGGCPSGTGANPVDYSTGMKIEKTTDISFGGARGGLELTRVYTSDLAQTCDFCSFGRGATNNYDVRLVGGFQTGGAGRVIMPDESTGRLFGYDHTEPDGTLVFNTTDTLSQLGDTVRRTAGGALEYRRADGGVMRFDGNGRLVSIADRNGNTTTLSYVGSQLTRISDAVGRSITLEYDFAARIAKATDPLGRVWRYTYEGTPGVAGGPGLTTVTDPLNHVTHYSYVIAGRLASVTDPRGSVVKQLTYDDNGRVISQRFADGGTERYDYTLSGGIVTATTITDPLGRTETKRFNAGGFVVGITDALGQSSQISRNIGSNLPVSSSGPCGCAEVTRGFDSRGNVTAVTNRAGQTTRFDYEPDFNRVTKVTDKLGHVTTLAYDGRGNLTSITNALGRTANYTYDGFGQLTAITDPTGHTARVEYDASGNITAVVDALGDRTTFESDAVGRVTAATDPLGRRTSMTYDADDRLVTLTDPAGAVTRYEYDANGNRTKTVDALGREWKSSYTNKNLTQASADPLGRVVHMLYNSDDELTFVSSPSGRVMTYDYDERGRVKTITDSMGGAVRHDYDAYGNLLSLTDARGNTTTYSYDELHRQTGSRNPLGQASSLDYDANGNVTKVVDRMGRQVTFTYDALNRTSRVNYADAVVTYGYDDAGRRTRVDDTQGGFTAWSHDDAGRLLSETTQAGAVQYTYNAAGQRTSMKAADRPPLTYGYGAAGRLEKITEGAENFVYSYDQLSRVSGLRMPNGVMTSYGYDVAGRLERLTHLNALNQTIEDYQYTFNDDGEFESVTSLLNATRPPAAKSAADADPANRISRLGDAGYSFDLRGQTTAKSRAAGTTAYEWDARGRLKRATLPDGREVNYGYDASGRLASRASGGVTTSYLYDGRNVVLERGSDGAAVGYLTGKGVDHKLRQTGGAAGTLYFLHDHLSSTLALTDAGGNVAEVEQYDQLGESAGSARTRYGYAGRLRDKDTGLLYNRARWYDPQQGRFLSEDPIGIKGGLNFYSYAGNNSLRFTDPSGRNLLDTAGNLVNKAGDFAGDVRDTAGSVASTAITGEAVLMDHITGGFTRDVRQAIGNDNIDYCSTIAKIMGPVGDVAQFVIVAVLTDGLGEEALLAEEGVGLAEREAIETAAGGACFVGGTLVQTADGEKRIEDVVAGDEVLSADVERGAGDRLHRQQVTRTFVHDAPAVLDIRVGNTTITSTPEHPFWVVGRGWRPAGELQPGSTLQTKDGRDLRVASVRRREGSFKVYNLEVSDAHTFYVSPLGILVHNQCARTWPRTPEEMDELMGFEGRRIPDGPNTPGRNKVEWPSSDNVNVTYEQHPYHPDAPEWHRNPHWHMDTPGRPHSRHLPGEPLP
jgi:RHS repeat-associated protein